MRFCRRGPNDNSSGYYCYSVVLFTILNFSGVIKNNAKWTFFFSKKWKESTERFKKIFVGKRKDADNNVTRPKRIHVILSFHKVKNYFSIFILKQNGRTWLNIKHRDIPSFCSNFF